MMLNDAFMMKTMVTLPINTETNVICLEAHHDQVGGRQGRAPCCPICLMINIYF